MSGTRFLVAAIAVVVTCAMVVAVVVNHRGSPPRTTPVATTLVDGDETSDVMHQAAPLVRDPVPEGAPAAAVPEPDAVTAGAPEPARPNKKHKKAKPKPASETDARRRTATGRATSDLADSAAIEAAAVARQALAYVGADPVAEIEWANAINDSNRTAHERQDLIEDLNEEGFPDPHHPTPDDLPLIESRLALIEEYAPDAMDEVNAAAFAEAYKDLLNMYVRASEP